MLTGALAPQLSSALSFGVAGLGVAFAIQSGVGAVASIPLGRLVDRLGATRSIRIAMGMTAMVSFSIALAVRSFAMLVALLTVSALAKRMTEPASNRLLINRVDPRRLGLAFGVKQSAPPTAVMIAGMSVPLVAAAWGWRSAYLLAGSFALLLIALIRKPRTTSTLPRRQSSGSARTASSGVGRQQRVALITLTVAFGLANGASVTGPAFYVSAAVAAGASPPTAGSRLALASIAAILARLVLGAVADRLVTGHLGLCASMLLGGSLGFALLASGDPVLGTVGIVLALAGAWGFSGVFWFTLVRANPGAPGGITGKVAPGALIANSLSPLVFGLVADRFSYSAGWAIAASMAAAAAVAMLIGQRQLVRADTS